MKRKFIAIVCIVAIVLVALGGSVFIKLIKTQSFISRIEQNNSINEKEKSEILEIYTDSELSNDDKEELEQFLKEYPELFYDKSDFQEEKDNFDAIQLDCENVVQNIETYIEYNQCEQPFCVSVYKEDNKTILMGWDVDKEYAMLTLDISVYESFLSIEEYFSEKGYLFSIIRVAEDTICFNTENGRYSLMYTLDGISPKDKGLDVIRNRQYDITQISGNWYYSVFDKHV